MAAVLLWQRRDAEALGVLKQVGADLASPEIVERTAIAELRTGETTSAVRRLGVLAERRPTERARFEGLAKAAGR